MKSFADYRQLEEAHQVVAKTKQGETFKSAVYPTKDKAMSMHYKMAKSGNYKSIETVPVKEEVDLDEDFKKGDFVKDSTGKIHRVFGVTGNTLSTGEYRGNNGYGGTASLHKTKATKVPTPKDVKDDLDEALDKGEYDYEGQMARTQLQTTMRNCKDMIAMITDDDNMPEWVQSKITLAQDYITSARDYLQSKQELGESTLDELNQMTLSRYAGKARSVINTNLAMAGDKSTSAGKSKEMYDKIRKRAAGVKTANRKMASGEYSEEVEQLEEMTQGKEYTQAQLQKKIQSGNWEATHDIKPGKHVEMRHHSGKRVTVQVKEETVQEASELGDLAHQTTMKHRFLVTYSDPNHTSASMRKEKQQKHVLVPGSKNGESIYKGEAEPLVKKYMNKQGYRVHEIEHVGMVSKKVNEDTKLDEADVKDYHSVHVNGRMWKTFDSKSHADNVAKKIKGATVHKYDAERLQQNYGAKAAARNAARGKQWDENTTTENKTI